VDFFRIHRIASVSGDPYAIQVLRQPEKSHPALAARAGAFGGNPAPLLDRLAGEGGTFAGLDEFRKGMRPAADNSVE